MQGLNDAKPVLDRVQKMLKENDRSGAAAPSKQMLDGIIAPGEAKSINIDGPAAIRSLEFQIEAAQTLWCPIGDFFGTGYHVRPHATWYTGVAKDNTLASYWVMPFEKKAQVEILNLGSQPVKLTKGLIRTGP